MSCAAARGDFPDWTGRVATPLEEITPETDVNKLLDLLCAACRQGAWREALNELEKALDQEYLRGMNEARQAIGAALRYRPISPDETR